MTIAAKLAAAGFEQIDIEPTRIYSVEDAREFLAGAGHRRGRHRSAGGGEIHERFHPRREARLAKHAADPIAATEAAMQGRYNVLFLCTGNSARSIMAEAILKHRGGADFVAYSAGSNPSGTVRPAALAQLESAHMPTRGLRSKSWEEFASSKAPELDFVFTVCDHAAKEVCPIWPGNL